MNKQKPKTADWDVHWAPREGGRAPRVPPNRAFPNGKHIDIAKPELPSCKGDLPYTLWPEHGLGLLMVTCRRCGMTTGITTAGRPDDPISLTQNCAG
jgi:hypothetical protein